MALVLQTGITYKFDPPIVADARCSGKEVPGLSFSQGRLLGRKGSSDNMTFVGSADGNMCSFSYDFVLNSQNITITAATE